MPRSGPIGFVRAVPRDPPIIDMTVAHRICTRHHVPESCTMTVMREQSFRRAVALASIMAFAVTGCSGFWQESAQDSGENQEIPKIAYGKDVDSSTRPIVELERFIDAEIISVTEYWYSFGGALAINRVHRLTYKADYEEEVVLWREVFPESDGWTVDRVISNEIIIGQDYRDGKVAGHGMILEPGTYARDETAHANTVKVEDYDYVRVALNEYEWPEQKEPLSTIVALTSKYDQYIEIPVPKSAVLDGWEQSEKRGKTNFTFSFQEERDDGDSSYHMLELWLKKGSVTNVVVVQLSEDFPRVPGLAATTKGMALLLDEQSVVGRFAVEFDGASVTVEMPDTGGWEPCLAISRWAPAAVDSPYERPELIYVRVSSIKMAPERLEFVRPNLWFFYRPVKSASN